MSAQSRLTSWQTTRSLFYFCITCITQLLRALLYNCMKINDNYETISRDYVFFFAISLKFIPLILVPKPSKGR
jgi:hypothetical protein